MEISFVAQSGNLAASRRLGEVSCQGRHLKGGLSQECREYYLPYNVAEVELEEGPRILTNLVGVANDDIRAGMAVEIVFDDVTDDIALAKFKPRVS